MPNKNLPNVWKKINFGGVVNKINDKVHNRDEWTFKKYIGGEHFYNGEIRVTKSNPIEGNEEVIGSAFHMKFKPGQVLYVTRNPRLRKGGMVDFEGVCSNVSFVMEADETQLLQSLLPFIIQTEDFVKHTCNNAHGSTNPFLNWKDIAKYNFLLPPIEEQKKISEVLWGIEDSIKEAENVIKLENIFYQKMMRHLFNKGLGHSKYKKNKTRLIPEEWIEGKFSDYVDFQEGPGIMAKDFTDSGVPLLRISNLRGSKIDLIGCNFLSPEKVNKKWEHFRLKEKDVLISSSASTGLISEVTKESGGAIAYTGIIRLRPLDNLDRQFMKYYMGSEGYLNQIKIMQTGSTIKHYGPTHLKKVLIPIPPLHEQKQIVKLLDDIQININARELDLCNTKLLRQKLSNELLKGELRLD